MKTIIISLSVVVSSLSTSGAAVVDPALSQLRREAKEIDRDSQTVPPPTAVAKITPPAATWSVEVPRPPFEALSPKVRRLRLKA